MTTALGELDIEAAAKQAAGNHQRFQCFAWFGRPDDSEDWAIIYTHNRDSGPLDLSNAEVIAEALKPFAEAEPADIVFESHNHWAVGHVDGFSIRVYRDGKITDAFRAYHALAEAEADYPILDESHYSAKQADTIEQEYSAWARYDFIRELEKRFDVELETADDPPGALGQWRQEPPELFNAHPREVYRYFVPNCESAFRELFEQAAERANVYWEECSNGMSINVRRVAEAVELDTLAPFILGDA